MDRLPPGTEGQLTTEGRIRLRVVEAVLLAVSIALLGLLTLTVRVLLASRYALRDEAVREPGVTVKVLLVRYYLVPAVRLWWEETVRYSCDWIAGLTRLLSTTARTGLALDGKNDPKVTLSAVELTALLLTVLPLMVAVAVMPK